MNINWPALIEALVSNFRLDATSIHGLEHWETVEKFGVKMAKQNRANVDVVRLFAYFHDSCRLTDDNDVAHGVRAAEYAESLRGKYFELPDKDFDILYYACLWHNHWKISDDVTIGTCWDADRLDLARDGNIPDIYLLSTKVAQEMLKNNEQTISVAPNTKVFSD